MYNVLLTRRALNDLDALQKQDRVRIIKKLKEYSTAPLKYALKLEKPKWVHIDLELEITG